MSQGAELTQKDGSTTVQEARFAPAISRRHWLARAFKALVFAATLVGIVFLAVLLVDIARDGVSSLSWGFITSFPSSSPENAGIYPALLGSLWLVGLTALFSVPLGVGAAVYLEEYATDNWLSRIAEVNISNLAGVPSVIYGLLALGIFVNLLSPLTNGPSILSGAMALTLLILPVIIIAAREAVRAVPESLREGALALGATRWEVIWHHVLPSAFPGALTGTILALSRAIGETAPLIVVGAATYLTFAPDGPLDRFSALPIQIYYWVSQPQEEFQIGLASAGIVVLMVVLLLANSGAIWLRNRFQKRG